MKKLKKFKSSILLLFYLILTLNEASAASKSKYAPNRQVDVEHLKVDMIPDFQKRSIYSTATIDFEVIAKPFRSLILHGIDLEILNVTSNNKIESFDTDDAIITILFEKELPLNQKHYVSIEYRAKPKDGLFWRTPELGYPKESMQIHSHGQMHRHRHWIPSFDYPNEKATSEIICHVPEGMQVVSNGRLISQNLNAQTGLVAFHWKLEKKHPNYLIGLVAGYLESIQENYNGIELGFYVPPEKIELAQNSFRETAEILNFFETELGVPYPWGKTYNQAIAIDFWAGGMENTSITILGDNKLFTDKSQNLYTTEVLNAHELAHQWFGDYLTCKDWSHLWLNEGFATYYSALHLGNKYGHDELLYYMYKRGKKEILKEHEIHLPMIHRDYDSPQSQFDYRAYPKGAWILHMLRTQIGPKLYRKTITKYIQDNAEKSVVTEDLNQALEETTGLNFDRFFKQYVYQKGHPSLKLDYKWNSEHKIAKISIQQIQNKNGEEPFFHIPTQISFTFEDDKVAKNEIIIDKQSEDYTFHLESKPKIVRFDPEFGVLANVEFKKPTKMLYAQLENNKDIIGRLKAIEGLKNKLDDETIKQLKNRIQTDPHYGVSVVAADTLKNMGSKEANNALVSAWNTIDHQSADPRIRLAILKSLGEKHGPENLDIFNQVIDQEDNPHIVAAAIKNLGFYPSDGINKRLVELLSLNSYQNYYASAAIDAMKEIDDETFIVPLLEYLENNQQKYGDRSFSNALGDLAHLARNAKDKRKVLEFFKSILYSEIPRIKIGAIKALGTLEEPKAIPYIERHLESKIFRIREVTEKSIKKLEKKNTGLSLEIAKVKRSLKEIKKENKALESKFEDLKKSFEGAQN